jgi:hypothetical protein
MQSRSKGRTIMSLYIINKNSEKIRLSAMLVHKTGDGNAKFDELISGTIQSIEQDDLKNVTEIRSNAFNGMTVESVEIPSNVTTIGMGAFANNKISEVTIDDGVVTIGDSAFENNQINTITIPQSVTTIGDGAFATNPLTEITMESNVPPVVTSTTFPSTLQKTNVSYNGYLNYESDSNWQTYKDTLVRGLAIPSTITVIVNNYLNELVNGATVTIEGNGQTFTGLTNENGVFVQSDLQPATYTVSVADIDGYKTPAVVEIVVEENTQNSQIITYLEKPSTPLFADATAQDVSRISAEIAANNMTSQQVAEVYNWHIGDIKPIALTTGEVIDVQIIGFNHDDKSDGSGKAGITLQTVNCLPTMYKMKATGSNYGGYGESIVKTSTLPDIKSLFNSDWQNVMKFVDKKYANGGSEAYKGIVTLSEDLFLLSEVEVFGKVVEAQNGAEEGTVYEYWVGKGNSYRIKKVADTNADWWLRSCDKDSAGGYCVVYKTGIIYTYTANRDKGISFAFCV